MNNAIINQAPYLFTSRRFPNEDMAELATQIDIAYLDIANKVNDRTISLFPTTRPAQTGEKWFIENNRRQEGFRQVYNFTTSNPASIDAITHNIRAIDLERFVRLYGTYTDGTNWYGLLGASSTIIAGQISFYVTPTQIIFLVDAAAPAVTRGEVVLEWISRP